MKKRLLITGSTFPRYENDTEPRFILDLAKYMKEYAEVTVLVPAAPKAADTEVLEGVSVIRYHYFPVHANSSGRPLSGSAHMLFKIM